MILMADTREQQSLDFSGLEGVEKVENVALPYGDYTAIIHDKPVPIVFERKGLGDLFGTMTSGYERFKREMKRAKDDNIKLILIIEGSYSEVADGFEHSQFEGKSMLKKLAMMYVRHDLEYIFCESRRVMARRIVDTFSAVERNWSKGVGV
jgi:ERCC4-type nuclease